MIEDLKKVILIVDGMKCSGCVSRIDALLDRFSEISTQHIDLESHKVEFFCKKELDIQSIISKIEDLGFSVRNVIL